MDEFALIRQYFAKAISRPDVALGIGDDCALLRPPADKQLAVSLDTLVEGVHFPVDAKPGEIATRSFLTALSDLAAMGAEPLWVTMGLTLPTAKGAWVSEFCASFLDIAERYGCDLVGGDMTRGPLTISVQVHGAVAPAKAMKRSGAQAGDTVYVTGHIGDGAAALAVLQGELDLGSIATSVLKQHFYTPKPRIDEGLKLAGVASAAIDISDGLYADLGHICAASGVGAIIETSHLPINLLWSAAVAGEQALKWALTGGDDYQLCFTVPADESDRVNRWIQLGELEAVAIGRIVDDKGISLLRDGEPLKSEGLLRAGYTHF